MRTYLAPLLLAACGTPDAEPLLDAALEHAAPVADWHAPAPGELDLRVTGGVMGGTITFDITGANYGERVFLLRSAGGVGEGPCFDMLGGQCLSLLGRISRQVTLWTDEDGAATEVMDVADEPYLDGLEACFQPVILRGPGGSLSEIGEARCLVLGPDADGDGVPDGADPCPDDPLDGCLDTWVFGLYDVLPWPFDPSTAYNGYRIGCPDTCALVGGEAIGARIVCNNTAGGTREGCDDANHGEWTDAFCSEAIIDGVYVPGPSPTCGGEGRVSPFLEGPVLESMSYHAIECQCRPCPADSDADGICDADDACPLDSDNDGDGDGRCGDVDPCPLDPDDDADGDGLCGDIDPCPDALGYECFGHGEGWVFGLYDVLPWPFDPSTAYNGYRIGCPDTCALEGGEAIGVRIVCNNTSGGTREGCDDTNHGEWTHTFCTEAIIDGVYSAGPSPTCGGEGRVREFLEGPVLESMSYHAIECQCG